MMYIGWAIRTDVFVVISPMQSPAIINVHQLDNHGRRVYMILPMHPPAIIDVQTWTKVLGHVSHAFTLPSYVVPKPIIIEQDIKP